MHLYTLEEARALLPRVVAILVELRDLAPLLRAHADAARRHRRIVPGNGHLSTDAFADGANPDVERANQRWRELTRQLEEWGVELKDPDTGLVDFHHERAGEVVYLCYRLGEPDIAWWHTLDGGFAGRNPL